MPGAVRRDVLVQQRRDPCGVPNLQLVGGSFGARGVDAGRLRARRATNDRVREQPRDMHAVSGVSRRVRLGGGEPRRRRSSRKALRKVDQQQQRARRRLVLVLRRATSGARGARRRAGRLHGRLCVERRRGVPVRMPAHGEQHGHRSRGRDCLRVPQEGDGPTGRHREGGAQANRETELVLLRYSVEHGVDSGRLDELVRTEHVRRGTADFGDGIGDAVRLRREHVHSREGASFRF